jgi:hypothetical protein
MPAPKKMSSFRLGAIDRLRLQKLVAKKETNKSAVVREALKVLCEKEGIKIK